MCEVAPLTMISRGERQTVRFGRILGRLLRPGAVVALSGELGAGKTRLVKGIAEGLRVPDAGRVSSPSFALIHEHGGDLTLYHMDFYRLSPGIWEPELGLEEYLWGEGVCVIEWAERLEAHLPTDRLDVRLEILGPRKRRIRVFALGPLGRSILQALHEAMPETEPIRSGGRPGTHRMSSGEGTDWL